MRKMFSILAAMVLFSAVQLRAAGPSIGSPAPAFSLTDQNGKTVSLSDFAGKIVVLEWFNEGCPFVQRHYQAGDMSSTAAKYAGDGVVWLAINSTHGSTEASNKQADASWKMNRPILNDASGAVGHAYDAKNTPQMFVIDKNGKLVYDGAIDNDPEGEKTSGKVNYVAKALEELVAGKAVSEPMTKPYGCHVHYAN